MLSMKKIFNDLLYKDCPSGVSVYSVWFPPKVGMLLSILDNVNYIYRGLSIQALV